MLTFLYSLIHSFTGGGDVSSAEYIIAASVGILCTRNVSTSCKTMNKTVEESEHVCGLCSSLA